MRRSIGIAMKRSLWLCAAALVAYGTPAFGQTLADYDAAIVTAQAELDTATAAFNTAQTAKDTAQTAVDTAKATRDELKAARDLIDRETAEWKAAHKKFKEAADAVWDAREVRDAASHTVGMTRIAKLQAETTLQETVDARVAYLTSPAGQQELTIAALESSIAHLQAERDTLQAERDTLTTALQAANADNQTIQEELDLVTTVLDIAMEDILQAAEKLTTLQAQLADLEQQIATLETERDTLRTEMTTMEETHQQMETEAEEMRDSHVSFVDAVVDGCIPYPDGEGGYTLNTDSATCVDARVLALSPQGCRDLAGRMVTIEVVDIEGGYIVWSPKALELWGNRNANGILLYGLDGGNLPAGLHSLISLDLPHWDVIFAADAGTLLTGYKAPNADTIDLIESHPVDGLYPWSEAVVRPFEHELYEARMAEMFYRLSEHVEDGIENPHCPGF